MEVRLFPHNVLLSDPAAYRPFLLFFRDALLMVRKQAVTPVISARFSESDESLTSVFECFNNNSDAVDPNFLELKRRHW